MSGYHGHEHGETSGLGIFCPKGSVLDYGVTPEISEGFLEKMAAERLMEDWHHHKESVKSQKFFFKKIATERSANMCGKNIR